MEPERRNEKIEVRVSSVEKAGIRERALAAGMRLSDYIRDRALCVPVGALALNQPDVAGQTTVEDAIIAAEIEEAQMDDAAAREAFLVRRTRELHGRGRTTPAARREAEREWEERGT